MGQKVHPTGFRLGYIKDWDSKWFADRQYTGFLQEDLVIRKFFREDERMKNASVAKVEISREPANVTVTVHTAKPGIIIGKAGRGVDALRQDLEKYVQRPVHVNVTEARRPDLDAQLVAEKVATQLSRRVSFRRAMKQAIRSSMDRGAKGIKIICSGRLGGAEMTRTVQDKEGKIPLQTLRADIDYGFMEAPTTYGNIGVKVWIYRGDVLLEGGAEERVEVTGRRGDLRTLGSRKKAGHSPGRGKRGAGRHVDAQT